MGRIDDVERQLDRRIQTQQRELTQQLGHLEVVLREKDRATELLDIERAKTALTLQAALERMITEGDARLRDHVANQIMQVTAALVSADKLELERIGSVQHELQQAQEASTQAVAKAEIATEKRFESVNEWRAQSQDRERSQAEERAKLQSSFILKEVADGQFAQRDSQFDQIRTLIASLTSRLDTIAGQDQGATVAKHNSDTFRTLIISVLMVAIGALTIVAITGGFH